MIYENPNGGFHRNKPTELGLISSTRRLLAMRPDPFTEDDFLSFRQRQKILRFKKK